MRRAVQLARQGQGLVEPNPMVGCVIVRDGQILSEGFHGVYGGPHAEIVALDAAARSGRNVRGATIYVTLEPCSHQGKTPPCADAILEAGLARVVIAQPDPFPLVDGGGIQRLRDAGLQVEVGLLEEEARRLNAPYLTLIEKGRPWVIAKWAMTLDGKIASRTGSSQWISNARSRDVVHDLRGRVDAIVVGARTAGLDDPSLTPRPGSGEPLRTPARVVLDADASLPCNSQLARSADDAPVLVFVGPNAAPKDVERLSTHGIEVVTCPTSDADESMTFVLQALAGRKMTNILVEGGGAVLGSLFDIHAIDEIHVFIGPKLIGGVEGVSPLGGVGLEAMPEATTLVDEKIELLDGDIHVWGRVKQADPVD